MKVTERAVQIGLTLAGLAGLAVPFVPFTFDVVPFTDVLLGSFFFSDDGIRLMALPTILLPLPILAGHAVRLITSRSPTWIDVLGYALAFPAVVVFLIGAADAMDVDVIGVLIMLLAATAFSGGLWSSLRTDDGARRGDGILALQAAYLPTTAFWVTFAFVEDAQLGAWLAAITVLAYALQVVFNVASRGRTLLLLLPLAAIAALMIAVE